jgi:uncharacterized lipoprotein YddW (UPF0748 family)
MYEEVKKAKPWVLVGISPFGIWRPGNPPGIVGLDQYSSLYADARLWQQQGWLDYLTPQLYWQVDSKGQSYPALLGWWAEQNVKRRHLWPGNFTSKVRRKSSTPESREAWSAEELLRQIEATRAQQGASGNVHFSMKALMQNYDGIADKLKDGPYSEPALVPESRWLGRETPAKPEVVAQTRGSGMTIDVKMLGDKQPWQWLVRAQTDKGWESFILPGTESRLEISLQENAQAKAVTVSGVSRLSRVGRPARTEIKARD